MPARLSAFDFNVRLPIAGYERALMYMQPERTRKRSLSTGFAGAAEVLSNPSVEAAERELRNAGIDRIVIPGRAKATRFGAVQNRALVDYAAERPGWASVFVSANPFDADWRQELESLLQSEAVKGVVFEPGLLEPASYPDDSAFNTFFEFCQQRRLPVAIGAGGGLGPDCGFASPVYLDRVARDFADLTLIAIHGGWPWVTAALDVAYRRGNVFLMPDVYTFFPGSEPFHSAMNGLLSERFIFGTAYPFLPPDQALIRVRNLLPDETAAERVLWRNAAGILGFPEISGFNEHTSR